MESVKHFHRDKKMELRQKVVCNFRINGIDTKFNRDKLDAIFDEMSCTVKLNIAFGFVLNSITDNDSFKYYYAADNHTVFLNPVLISQQSDLDALKESLENADLLENVTCHRLDTKWKLFSLTNVTFFLYLMKNVPLGCRSFNLPERMLRNPTIKCLLSDSNYNPYHDILCFFSCACL